MKKLSVAIMFLVVFLFTVNSLVFAQVEISNAKQAKEYLLNPEKHQSEFDQQMFLEEKNCTDDTAFELVKNDHQFMKQLLRAYLDNDSEMLYIATYHASFVDDTLFLEIFQKCKSESTKEQAVRKITNQITLKKIADDYRYEWQGPNRRFPNDRPSNYPHFSAGDNWHNPRLGVLDNITDESYLVALLNDSNADINMRLKALSLIKAKNVIERYANIPQNETVIVGEYEPSLENDVIKGKKELKLLAISMLK